MTFRVAKEGGAYRLGEVLAHLSSAPDGLYEVEVRRVRSKGTDRQRGYLWGCVYPMVRDGLVAAGWDCVATDSDAHEWCKRMFAGRDVVNRATGETARMPSGTSDMDTAELTAYVERVRDWAAEYLGVAIPDPNSWWRTLGADVRLEQVAKGND